MPSFDPFASGAAITVEEPKPSTEFDPFATDAAQPAGEPDWNSLFDGVDGVERHMPRAERDAFASLSTEVADVRETKAAAINQSYLAKRLPMFSPESLRENWQPVKEAYAKKALGVDSPGITDSALYEAIGRNIKAKQAHLRAEFASASPYKKLTMLGEGFMAHLGENASEVWDQANTPFVALPSAPQIPDMPGLGMNNPALVAGLWNSVKPLLEGIETPLGAVTIPAAGILKGLSATYPLARAALVGMGGIFTGLMAKGTIEATAAAPAVLNDPNSTLQQRIEAVGVPVGSAAVTLLGALGTVMEMKGPAKGKALVEEMKGHTPEEAAVILRNEAAKADIPEMKQALEVAAEKLDGVSEKGLEATAKEAEATNTAKTTAVEAKTAPTPEMAVKAKESAMTVNDPKRYDLLTEQYKKLAPEAEYPSGNNAIRWYKSQSGPYADLGKLVMVKDGSVIAELGVNYMKGHEWLGANKEGATHIEAAVQVHPSYRRQGIATALYDKAEQIAGLPAKPALKLSDASRAFWDNRISEQNKSAKESSLVAIKNETIDAELKRMGLPEATHGQKLGFEQARQEAAAVMEKDPLAGQKLIRTLNEDPRPVTGRENALLLHELNRLRIERDAADTAFIEATKSGDQTAIDAAKLRVATAIEDFRLASEVDTKVGTENAQGLALRQMMMAEDYSLASMERQMTVANDGKPLTEAQTKQVRDLHAKIQDAEKKMAARLQAMKTRTANKAAEIESKLLTQDITKPEKPTPLHLDEPANRLKAELEILKLQFKDALERERYRQSSAFSKVRANAMNIYDTARLLMTTGEFSFIMRQGKTAVLSHPILTAKALPNTFKALMEDATGAHALNLQVLNHPDAARARAAKLHLLDEGASLHKQEEMMMAKWAGSIPVVGRFNQAATVFLNRIRFDLWQTMRKVGMNAAEEKQLAMFVNEATGRGGLGSLEAAAVPLGRLMFSPRFMVSRFQLALGHSLWGGTFATRRAIANEYARVLVGLSAYYSTLYMAMTAGNEDVEIGTDPRSTGFGKVKIGNSRLDPLAGVSQVVVFSARTISGEKTTNKGNVRPIRGADVPYGGDKWTDVAANFARSKLHPVPASIVNLFDGTDLGGKEADVANQALNMSAPITWGDIYLALEEQDLPEGAALGLLAMLGEGLQTQKKESNWRP